MIYELRTYEPHEGKAEQLRARFVSHTLRLFRGCGIDVLAVLRSEPDDGRLCYVTRFADEAARAAAWAQFSKDKEWLGIKAASEVDGPLLKTQSIQIMTPLSFELPAFGDGV